MIDGLIDKLYKIGEELGISMRDVHRYILDRMFVEMRMEKRRA
jgi:hypothetical protein